MDYSKKKNAELEDLLKSRGLPHTGKKADLIARLQQHDAEHTTGGVNGASSRTNGKSGTVSQTVTEEIKNDARATAMAAGGKGQVANPLAVPNQQADIPTSQNKDLTVLPSKGEDANGVKTPQIDAQKTMSAGLDGTQVDTELAKRQSRAARFGLQQDTEAEKALARAKKFGIEPQTVTSIDAALSERQLKRGRVASVALDDATDAGRRDNKRNKAGRPRPTAGLSEKDRLAAEARKKRFGLA